VASDAAMNRIIVVGIGADGMAGLAPRSVAELQSATVIYGWPRQLELLDAGLTARRRECGAPFGDVLAEIRDSDGADIHVVASGDPMLHGIGSTLVRCCGRERVTVLPHVSSVTLACAHLGWPVQDTEVISLMTAGPEHAVRRGGRAIVLSRDGSSPLELARLLYETGRGESRMVVAEQLGGPAERFRDTTARHLLAESPGDIDALNIVAVEYLPDDRHYSILPDDALAHDGQLTKQLMRAVTMAALAPSAGERLWDVGSGSGSIAVEWCRTGYGCTAVAFERDELRRSRIAHNALAFGVDIEVRGAAPEAYTGVPAPDVVFIGGGVTAPGVFDGCWQLLKPGGRLIANTVTAESEAFVLQRYCELGGEVSRFQHYHGKPVGTFTGWHPAMPITQWKVVKP